MVVWLEWWCGWLGLGLGVRSPVNSTKCSFIAKPKITYTPLPIVIPPLYARSSEAARALRFTRYALRTDNVSAVSRTSFT